MEWKRALEQKKEPVAGFAGAGAGLFFGELTSEFATRVTGLTGYPKAGAKTLVKFLMGLGTFLAGVGSRGVGYSFFWKAFGFANWGSIILDWLYAVYPGGVFGMSERAAVTVRTWAMGSKKVAQELGSLAANKPSSSSRSSQGRSVQSLTAALA